MGQMVDSNKPPVSLQQALQQSQAVEQAKNQQFDQKNNEEQKKMGEVAPLQQQINQTKPIGKCRKSCWEKTINKKFKRMLMKEVVGKLLLMRKLAEHIITTW